MKLNTAFPLFNEKTDWEYANKKLYRLRLTDGLPVFLPTQQKVERMLEKISDRDKYYGKMPPGYLDVIPVNVAYQAILAGCVPEEFPAVLAAVVAALNPEFNLLGIQTTTGSTTAGVILHGPIIDRLGANNGSNCLGAGNRVNACIGRAVRLALMNLGSAYPGEMDMSTMGQPGKYTFCFAESRIPSTIPPYHVRKGYNPVQDAVSLIGISGTIEIYEESANPKAVLDTIASSVKITSNISSTFDYMGSGELFILIPPEISQIFDEKGYRLAEIQQYLFERAAVPKKLFSQPVQSYITQSHVPIAKAPKDIHLIVTGGAGIKMTYLQTWTVNSTAVTYQVMTEG
jgi:hypothetical protein